VKRLVVVLLVSSTACDKTRLVPALMTTVTPVCLPGEFSLERATPAVMLVLDRSGSMESTFGTGTRWSTLRSSLSTTLPSLGADVELGAFLYPSPGVTAAQCTVPDAPALTPAANQVAAVKSLLSATSPGGATPTADAIDAAANALEGSISTDKPRALVLATDGAPNCNPGLSPLTCTCVDGKQCVSSERCLDDARTVGRVRAWSAAGVPTWVIGIAPDTQLASVLDALATAGGRPNAGAHRFFSAASPTELTTAFAAIQTQLRSCVFVSPSVPDTGGTVTVRLDGVEVAEDEANGWLWSAIERGELTLRGAACERAAASTTGMLQLSITCGASDGGTTSVVAD
jgi:hypothetical protein